MRAEGAAAPRGAVHARHLPRADAARRGPGQPFPYISGLSHSLGVLASTRRARGAVRAREGAGGPRPLRRRGGRLVPLESVIAHFLPSLFPGWRSRSGPSSASRATPTSSSPTTPTTSSRRSSSSCGGGASATSSGSRSPPRRRGDAAALREGLDVEEDQIYEIEGLLDLADLMQLTRLDRPDLKDEPWVPITQPRLARVKDGAHLRRDPTCRPARPPAVRVVPDELRGLRRGRRADPDVIAMKTAVYRTSDDSTLVRRWSTAPSRASRRSASSS